MWPGFDPTPYTRDEYAAHVASLPHLPWVKFLVVHNTGSPTLAQWVDAGVSEVQRLANLEHYYEVTEQWHAGPHGFVSRNHICGFSDPTKPGVHASCFNSVSLGFEMVGDYSTESFSTGDGALVRDNAVFAFAVWHRKLGLRPDKYVYGITGVHPHKACLRDHHDCPGRGVDMIDFRQRVLAEMEILGGVAANPLPQAPAPAAPPPPLSAYLRFGSKGALVEDLQRVLNVDADGIFGSKTEAAVEAFQKAHPPLFADGIVGPKTQALLPKGAST